MIKVNFEDSHMKLQLCILQKRIDCTILGKNADIEATYNYASSTVTYASPQTTTGYPS